MSRRGAFGSRQPSAAGRQMSPLVTPMTKPLSSNDVGDFVLGDEQETNRAKGFSIPWSMALGQPLGAGILYLVGWRGGDSNSRPRAYEVLGCSDKK